MEALAYGLAALLGLFMEHAGPAPTGSLYVDLFRATSTAQQAALLGRAFECPPPRSPFYQGRDPEPNGATTWTLVCGAGTAYQVRVAADNAVRVRACKALTSELRCWVALATR